MIPWGREKKLREVRTVLRNTRQLGIDVRGRGYNGSMRSIDIATNPPGGTSGPTLLTGLDAHDARRRGARLQVEQRRAHRAGPLPRAGPVEDVDETVFLCVREDSVVKVIDTIETRKKLKISSPVGTRLPITASVFCKAFLAPMEDADIRDFLKEKGLPRYTPNSITDLDRFIDEIRVTRKRHYSLDLEEYLMGVRAIATLVYANDYPVGAICILGFTGSMPTDKLPEMAKRLVGTARKISERLSQ